MKGDEIWSVRSLDVHYGHRKYRISPKKTGRVGDTGTYL